MPDLERELRDLGAAIAFPPTPDLADPVRRRLAASERAPRRFSFRRGAVLALAVLVVALGAVLAVPQARTAVLEWLGLRGVTIERVPAAPTTPAAGRTLRELDAHLELGRRVTLDEARSAVRYPLVVPPAELGRPHALYLSEAAPGGQVAFVYRDEAEVTALFTEFRAELDEGFIHKTAGPGTEIEAVTVNGEPGWWLAGEPHEFVYVDPETREPRAETLRLATNTLLWQRGELTLRLEGDLTRDEALVIARAVAP